MRRSCRHPLPPHGWTTARINENGNRTEYEFDDAGRNTKITDASGNVTLMSYDVYGNVISMTDANGNTTMYEYDFSAGTVGKPVIETAEAVLKLLDQAERHL